MSDPKLTFIGGGNMANSIIGGLVAKGYDAQQITACDPLAENLEKLRNTYGINTESDNLVGIATADAVVLAVKPQVMGDVCRTLKAAINNDTLFISIAAGITIEQLSQWLGQNIAIVRCMPNTPALVQSGACGMFANGNTSADQKTISDRILSAVGIVAWLENEGLLDAVTAVSGSGPAYFFLLMEAMINAGVQQGLNEETARQLTLQTCVGAGRLAQSSDVDVAELRRRVTSPGGTTEQAILAFENDHFRTVVDNAMQACAKRAAELAEEFGNG